LIQARRVNTKGVPIAIAAFSFVDASLGYPTHPEDESRRGSLDRAFEHRSAGPVITRF
jgi:hypothetical protein